MNISDYVKSLGFTSMLSQLLLLSDFSALPSLSITAHEDTSDNVNVSERSTLSLKNDTTYEDTSDYIKSLDFNDILSSLLNSSASSHQSYIIYRDVLKFNFERLELV